MVWCNKRGDKGTFEQAYIHFRTLGDRGSRCTSNGSACGDMLIDLRGGIPCFIIVLSGKLHDVNAFDDLLLEPGVFYLMDRGYIDFKQLYLFNLANAFYVTRAKRNLDYAWRISSPVDTTTGLSSDQTIVLCGSK